MPLFTSDCIAASARIVGLASAVVGIVLAALPLDVLAGGPPAAERFPSHKTDQFYRGSSFAHASTTIGPAAPQRATWQCPSEPQDGAAEAGGPLQFDRHIIADPQNAEVDIGPRSLRRFAYLRVKSC